MEQELSTAERLERFFKEPNSQFVDPAKVEAYYAYGLDKAEEMWANGKPSDEFILRLNYASSLRAFLRNK